MNGPRLFMLAILAFTCCALAFSTTMANITEPKEAVTLSEDDPGWDCYEMGNLVCGDPGQALAVEAWESWDANEGWRHLRVDGTKPFKVEYVGTARLQPRLESGWVAMPSDDGWFVFKVEYQ